MKLALADVSDSIFSSYGVPECRNNLELKLDQNARNCIVLVDGLGQNAIEDFCRTRNLVTEFNPMMELTSAFPSTTAASLTSLGTGLSVGKHGMVGYTMRVPNSGAPARILNALKWDERVDPEFWQPNPTLFERAMKTGVSVSHIAAARFEKTGFTRAALRGAIYRSANSVSEQIVAAREALSKDRSFAYVYLNEVDEASHSKGYGSDKFMFALDKVEELVTGLMTELPKGCQIWITSDHGMLNRTDYVVVGDGNDLLEHVDLMAGEPRVRYLYTSESKLEIVRERWLEFFNDRVEIFSRGEAITAGLFGGEVHPDFIERIGDLIVIAKGSLILVEKARESLQIAMVGHHGGMTSDELEIPLLYRQN
jgi:predicted AlkP superfamily pyrophosphatase or phosphodiesterase